jgi:hypothetical protein
MPPDSEAKLFLQRRLCHEDERRDLHSINLQTKDSIGLRNQLMGLTQNPKGGPSVDYFRPVRFQ